jgi:hypothetical protein
LRYAGVALTDFFRAAQAASGSAQEGAKKKKARGCGLLMRL